jgi:hypothetical protein
MDALEASFDGIFHFLAYTEPPVYVSLTALDTNLGNKISSLVEHTVKKPR